MKSLMVAAVVLSGGLALAEEPKSSDWAAKGEGTEVLHHGYEMKGTVKNIQGDMLTIHREGMPAATLDVRMDTKILLDGKNVSVNALPEGTVIRAKFQVDGQKIVALEVHAMSAHKAKVPAAAPKDVKPQK